MQLISFETPPLKNCLGYALSPLSIVTHPLPSYLIIRIVSHTSGRDELMKSKFQLPVASCQASRHLSYHQIMP